MKFKANGRRIRQAHINAVANGMESVVLVTPGRSATPRRYFTWEVQVRKFGSLIGGAIAIALALLAITAPVSARAQDNGEQSNIAHDWNLRIGPFFFNSAAARAKSGSVGISGIAERTVYSTDRYEILVGAGYNGFGSVYSVPITISGIIHQNQFRYGAALGYAFGKRVESSATQGVLLGLIAGYQFTPTITGDIRYNFISGADNQLDGFSVTAGYRF
jgi:hypothetical protein